MHVTTASFAGRASHTQRWAAAALRIPRVFHFVWVGGVPPPPSVQVNMSRWLALHPGWDAKLWQEDNLPVSLINQAAFAAALDPREKADVLRYEVVLQLGGVYAGAGRASLTVILLPAPPLQSFADLDFEPLRNIEPILRGIDAFVAFENPDSLCNGIFGAVPRHVLLRRLVAGLPASVAEHAGGPVNDRTGPRFITSEALRLRDSPTFAHSDGEAFAAFSTHVFFPFSWGDFDPGPPYSPLSYAVHHFKDAHRSAVNLHDASAAPSSLIASLENAVSALFARPARSCEHSAFSITRSPLSRHSLLLAHFFSVDWMAPRR